MHKVQYSTGRVAFACLGMIAFIFAGVWMASTFDGKGAFAGWLVTICFIICLPLGARYLINGGLILEYDRHFVVFHGVLGTKRVRWEQVTGIEIEKQTYNGMTSNTFLKIKGPFSLLGYASLTQGLLADKHRPVEKLFDQLVNVHEEPQPAEREAIPASPIPRSRGVVGEAPLQPAAPRAGGFGRKGL